MLNILGVLTFLLLIFSCAHQSPAHIVQSDHLSIPKKDKIQKVRTVASAPRRTGLKLKYNKKHYLFWLKYFTKRDKERFSRFLKNGDKYRTIVHAIFKKYKIPVDLFYVGLIESGFQLHARSRASAVGPWQFIRGTGRRYGLKINRHIDERKNIYKSTEAAARYFRDLYNIFGSWELALCAYNAGEYRIINAIRKGNTRNYKELVRKKLIPKETIYYIPKVVAARRLDGIWKRRKNIRERKFFNNVRSIRIKHTFNLAKMARRLKISYTALKRLNPDIKSSWVRPGRKGLTLYVPKKSHRIVAKYIRKMNPIKNRIRRGIATKAARKKHLVYVVRKGDNLTRIARRFGVSLSTILRANRLKNKKIYPRQTIRIPQG